MKCAESVLLAFDGKSKCGKTTISRVVTEEARWHNEVYHETLENRKWQSMIAPADRESIASFIQRHKFDNIEAISAGNAFRAAALLISHLEEKGQPKTSFRPEDIDDVRELLAKKGVREMVQTDPKIGKLVSHTSKLPGAQALGNTIFCDQVSEAFKRDGGANLVVVDARDPVAHLKRNDLVGSAPDQIHPGAIMPIYIDTPIAVAASWVKGDYFTAVAEICDRRLTDATRVEFPVTDPDEVIHNFDVWNAQFAPGLELTDTVAPWRFMNGPSVELPNIQWLGNLLAHAASDQAINLRHQRPEHECSPVLV